MFKVLIMKKGFTLVELLVVVSLIGILAGIVIAVLKPESFFGRGRDAQRKSDLQSVRAALELYAVSQVDRKYPTMTGANGYEYYDNLTLDDYLDGSLSHDPKSSWNDYCYKANTDRTCFILRADLESAQDTDFYDVTGGKGTGCPITTCP